MELYRTHNKRLKAPLAASKLAKRKILLKFSLIIILNHLYCDSNETVFLAQDGPSKYDVIDAHAWSGMVSWPGC